jgi:single-stranded DNA-specific DHH superfamily exonuclease
MLENDTGGLDKAAGVQIALEKICALEARLRGAIQTMQPLSTSLSIDPKAAERERQGLFAVRL